MSVSHTAIDAEAALMERLQHVRARIAAAARESGRDEAEVTLVGVSKSVDRAAVNAAYACGLRDFGENRVQDARAKFEHDCPDDLRLHLIGSLQTNKVKQVVGSFYLIHSVDRVALVDALEARSRQLGTTQPILVQVNVAREEQKHGCLEEDVPQLIEHILASSHLGLRGLMTIAPLVSTVDEARPVFAGLHELQDRLESRYPEACLTDLSMGMTNDYTAAISEGATLVRVGRAIFADQS